MEQAKVDDKFVVLAYSLLINCKSSLAFSYNAFRARDFVESHMSLRLLPFLKLCLWFHAPRDPLLTVGTPYLHHRHLSHSGEHCTLSLLLETLPSLPTHFE